MLDDGAEKIKTTGICWGRKSFRSWRVGAVQRRRGLVEKRFFDPQDLAVIGPPLVTRVRFGAGSRTRTLLRPFQRQIYPN